jgi:hypothetical protein
MTIRSLKNGSITSLAAANTSVATPTYPTGLTPTKDTIDGGKINVAFTPSTIGGTATSFIATSTPGSLTGTANSSPIAVTGLTGGTSYTFSVAAINANGTGEASPASSAQTAPILTSTTFNTTGTWTAPAGVNAIELLMVAGGGNGGGQTPSMGGGGGGAGGFIRNTATAVTPSTSYTITVGAQGGVSNAFGFTAIAGGNGGNGSNTVNVGTGSNSGNAGGSGGGGGSSGGVQTVGGNATAGQGNAGNPGLSNRLGGSGGGLAVNYYGITYAVGGNGGAPQGFGPAGTRGGGAGTGGGGGGGFSNESTGSSGSVVIRFVS